MLSTMVPDPPERNFFCYVCILYSRTGDARRWVGRPRGTFDRIATFGESVGGSSGSCWSVRGDATVSEISTRVWLDERLWEDVRLRAEAEGTTIRELIPVLVGRVIQAG